MTEPMSTTPLIVPERLASLAMECQSAYRAPVAVEAYKRLTQKVLKRSASEAVIVVADFKPYSELAANGKGKLAGAHDVGKVLLLTPEDTLEQAGKLAGRGIDLMDPEVKAPVWAFKVNRCLHEIEFDREINLLKEEDSKARKDVDTLNEIGMALSTEKDLGKLLDMIVSKCREMTWADAGSLYLIEADPKVPEDKKNYFANKKMRFQVAQNDSRSIPFKSFVVDIRKTSIYGFVALTRQALNFDDAYFIPADREYRWGGKEFDASIGYRTMSMLTVPMVNWRGESIGVIQLINRKVDPAIKLEDPKTCIEHIRPFTPHDVNMAMSIASQASIAIQNAQLVNSIKGLFDGFIAASVKAIEARDPTTSGHSQRVAKLTVGLAQQVDKSDSAKFREIHFTEEQIQEIRYASLLHDFGKIGVRENVLVKAKKLYPDEMQTVSDRFEIIRRTIAYEYTERQLQHLLTQGSADPKAVDILRLEMKARLDKLEEYMGLVLQCNEPTVLAQGGFERLKEIAANSFKTTRGDQVAFLNEKELLSLSVPKGSLNANDRKEIESHVTHTYQFLSTIPWTAELRNVAEIAYAHHEKLDGTGYPNGLNAETIPIQSKMMTIADIFDALTAWDRPYKKAIPVERALNILVEEATSHHVDADLLDLFISSEVYKLVIP
ncbi:MAG: GAF domain-containing protein [Candidatus Lambdaproteobacteria bacterium]|nr:GAF domain-containing protein [Candidatus Lambdaproteobacteria bacterium]